MINTGDVKNRMSSISQTRQITRAMHLLSATKVRRDARWVGLTRTYFERVLSAMRDILEKSKGIEHRYVGERQGGRAAFIVIAGDKGLAGGYNHNALAFALERISERENPRVLAIGQTARAFFEARGFAVDADFLHAGQRPYLRHARRIVEHIFQLFDDGEVDEMYLVYTAYESSMSQRPRMLRLLPIVFSDYEDIKPEAEYSADVLYEPSPQAVFDVLVPEFAIGLLFGGMVQSYVSEHTARMRSMESATKNADGMLQKLKLEYNMARQYAITREIAEIVGAAEALSLET